MIVVSDTSPLNYLIITGLVDVLPKLFGDVFAPPEVITELSHPRAPEVVRVWAQCPPVWLRVTSVTGEIWSPGGLGLGETRAIALAKQLGATLVLMDERDGSRFAAAQGLCVVGTLAVLEQGASQGLLDLSDALMRLQNTTFRYSLALFRAALHRDAARKPDETKSSGSL